MIIAAALVCQKYYSDIFYSNLYVSIVSGLKQTCEINFLETEFINMVNWRITYSRKSYDYYLSGIQEFFAMPLSLSTLSIIERTQSCIALCNNGQL